MPPRNQLSVVVPAYNEEKLLPSCLQALENSGSVFEEPGWSRETIVCDNNSTDRTAEIATEAGAKVVFESHNQIARARNRGASVARGDWLLFLDADSLVSPELFLDLRRTMADPQVIGGGSCLKLRQDSDSPMNWQIYLWNQISLALRWAPGSFIFCRRTVFEEMNGFNLEQYAAEDVNFSRRLKRKARQTGKTVAILSHHPLATSSRKLDLYSKFELLKALAWLLIRYRRGVRDRNSCFLWYDGRR